jgi:hypothetical protein
MLVRRREPGDRARAIALLSEARGAYQAMAMEFYAARAGTLLDGRPSPATE